MTVYIIPGNHTCYARTARKLRDLPVDRILLEINRHTLLRVLIGYIFGKTYFKDQIAGWFYALTRGINVTYMIPMEYVLDNELKPVTYTTDYIDIYDERPIAHKPEYNSAINKAVLEHANKDIAVCVGASHTQHIKRLCIEHEIQFSILE